MPALESSAAILLVADMSRAVGYYRDSLGFQAQLFGEPTNFAILERDGVRVMLALAPGGGNKPHWQIVKNMWNVYFWVDDARGLHDEFIRNGAKIDYGLSEKPYGLLEFGVQDPDGHDLAFGQMLK